MDDLIDESVLRGIEIPEPKDGIDDRRGDHWQHDDGLEQARPCVATDEIGGHDRNEQVKQDDQYHGAEDIDQRVCQDQPVIRIQENLLVVGEPDELPLEGGIQSGEGHDDRQDGREQIKQRNQHQKGRQEGICLYGFPFHVASKNQKEIKTREWPAPFPGTTKTLFYDDILHVQRDLRLHVVDRLLWCGLT